MRPSRLAAIRTASNFESVLSIAFGYFMTASWSRVTGALQDASIAENRARYLTTCQPCA